MRISYNQVILGGNLTREPELRYTQAGTPICKLGLAVNQTRKDKNGEKQERVDYFDVDVWGNQGEVCAKYLAKGRPVLVTGQLRLHTWATDDGQKRSKVNVKADRVQFLGDKSGDDSPPTDDEYDAPVQKSEEKRGNYVAPTS